MLSVLLVQRSGTGKALPSLVLMRTPSDLSPGYLRKLTLTANTGEANYMFFELMCKIAYKQREKICHLCSLYI